MKTYVERVILPLLAPLVVLLFTTNVNISLSSKVALGLALALFALLIASVAEKLTTESTNPITGTRKLLFGMLVVVLLPTIAYISTYLSPRARIGESKNASHQETSTSEERNLPLPQPGKQTKPQEPPALGEDSFAEKYLTKDISAGSGVPRWAVLIASPDQSSFPRLSTTVSDVLAANGYKKVSVFRPAILQDGTFEQIYAADPLLMRTLAEYCEGIIVAKLQSALRKDTAVEGLFTAELAIQVRVISTHSGAVKDEFSLRENGAGFSEGDAQARAEERLSMKLKERLMSALL